MPFYFESKIYRIVPTCEHEEGDVYIGSTTQPLQNRIAAHRSHYKNKSGKCSSHTLFEKYGMDNCKIELIEDYPCKTGGELVAREGEIQRSCQCVNKNISGRTHAEYRTTNLDRIREYNREYRKKQKERKLKDIYYPLEINIKNTL